VSLVDDATVVIYDCKMFIIGAAGQGRHTLKRETLITEKDLK
jgi:hypothetical protein